MLRSSIAINNTKIRGCSTAFHRFADIYETEIALITCMLHFLATNGNGTASAFIMAVLYMSELKIIKTI